MSVEKLFYPDVPADLDPPVATLLQTVAADFVVRDPRCNQGQKTYKQIRDLTLGAFAVAEQMSSAQDDFLMLSLQDVAQTRIAEIVNLAILVGRLQKTSDPNYDPPKEQINNEGIRRFERIAFRTIDGTKLRGHHAYTDLFRMSQEGTLPVLPHDPAFAVVKLA